MTRHPRRLFWVEALAAATAGLLTLATLISREWIELVFDADPDNSSGALEWLIVAALLIVAVSLSLMARREWRAAGPRAG